MINVTQMIIIKVTQIIIINVTQINIINVTQIFIINVTQIIIIDTKLFKTCFRRQNKDYTEVQLHRERKIGEIWKTNYQRRV